MLVEIARALWGSSNSYVDDVQSFLDRGLGVEGEASVHFRRDLSRYDLQDLLTKLDEETVESGVDLLVKIFTLKSHQLIYSREGLVRQSARVT